MSSQQRAADLAHLMVLLSVSGLGSKQARALMEQCGSAQAVFEADVERLKPLLLTQARTAFAATRSDLQKHLDRAYSELDFIDEHNIHLLTEDDADYPHRLRSCPDTPLLLYSIGNANLNMKHTVAIIGTRHCTQYGRDCVAELVTELRTLVPDTLIVSGLALGIDGAAHEAALRSGLPTVGVLAHGLDKIYPPVHRDMASAMLQQGGLLTEYRTGTHADRRNFIARNHIVAGLADVTIVVESATQGGSLVTANIAGSYHRRVCAFPGRIHDERSTGCNQLITQGKASLITCAQDLMALTGWARPRASHQQELGFDEVTDVASAGKAATRNDNLNGLTVEERQIVELLTTRGAIDLTTLAERLCLETGLLYELLLDLEMKKIIRPLGNTYQLR